MEELEGRKGEEFEFLCLTNMLFCCTESCLGEKNEHVVLLVHYLSECAMYSRNVTCYRVHVPASNS
jgi:hypothetical protein